MRLRWTRSRRWRFAWWWRSSWRRGGRNGGGFWGEVPITEKCEVPVCASRGPQRAELKRTTCPGGVTTTQLAIVGAALEAIHDDAEYFAGVGRADVAAAGRGIELAVGARVVFSDCVAGRRR